MLKDADACCCWTEYLSPSTVTQGRLWLAFGFQEVYRLSSVQLVFLMPTCCRVSQLSLFKLWKILPWCEKMMRKATQRVYMRSQVIRLECHNLVSYGTDVKTELVHVSETAEIQPEQQYLTPWECELAGMGTQIILSKWKVWLWGKDYKLVVSLFPGQRGYWGRSQLSWQLN